MVRVDLGGDKAEASTLSLINVAQFEQIGRLDNAVEVQILKDFFRRFRSVSVQKFAETIVFVSETFSRDTDPNFSNHRK